MRAMLLWALCVLPAAATDVGYVNSGAILQEMAEVRAMQSTLDTLREQLRQQGEAMVVEYKTKEREAAEKEQSGQLSPKDRERVLADLQERQQAIINFGDQMEKDLVEKEQQLLQPILDRVHEAVRAVAKEKGLEMIVDTSGGGLLYADPKLDMSDAVKSKL